MKKIVYTLFIILGAALSSCSSHNYENSIPKNSTALISLNAQQFVSGNSPFASIVTPFMDKDSKELKGIDLTRPFYMFEAGDGLLGFCAPVSDAYALLDFTKRLENISNTLKYQQEIDDKYFATINDSWVLGIDDNTLLVMGPVTGKAEQQKQIKRMEALMEQEEERGIKASLLWKHLQDQKGAMKLVAQTTALPKQFVSPLTLCAPKGTNPADVLIEAEMTYSDSIIYLHGKTCSYNDNITKSMVKAENIYKPLTIDWHKHLNDSTFAAVFMNVKGEDIMPFLNANRELATMLMTSEAYDRIRDNKGDLSIIINAARNTNEQMFSAKVKNLPPGKKKDTERLVAVMNLEALKGPMASFVAPISGKVKKVIYFVN